MRICQPRKVNGDATRFQPPGVAKRWKQGGFVLASELAIDLALRSCSPPRSRSLSIFLLHARCSADGVFGVSLASRPGELEEVGSAETNLPSIPKSDMVAGSAQQAGAILIPAYSMTI